MTGDERGFAILLAALVGAFVGLLASGIADRLGGQSWFNSGANVIQWMSGMATISAVASYLWQRWTRRCAVPWCIRQGDHPVRGTLVKVCDHHHTLDYHHVVHDIQAELHRLSGRLGWGESHDRPRKEPHMFKLGKRPATPDQRDIRLSAILREPAALPVPPAAFGNEAMYSGDGWEMLGNGPDDTVQSGFGGAGDCVFAGAAHETMETNRLAGRQVAFTGANVISDYSAVTGYQIGNDATDHGTDVRQALGYRAEAGVVDQSGTRHKIGAYVALDPKNWDQLRLAVYIFSAVGIGVEFPASAMDQFNAGNRWDVVEGAQIDGGHYVPVLGFTNESTGVCITWARAQPFTRAFYETYCDEAWAIVYPEELSPDSGLNERGLNLDALNAALAQL